MTRRSDKNDSAANVGYEGELWQMADALRGIDGQIAHGGTFYNDRLPDVKADYVLANPPFNDSDWDGALLRPLSWKNCPTSCGWCAKGVPSKCTWNDIQAATHAPAVMPSNRHEGC